MATETIATPAVVAVVVAEKEKPTAVAVEKKKAATINDYTLILCHARDDKSVIFLVNL